MSATRTIRVNGEQRTVSAGTTIAQLLADLGFGGQRVAVERNREVVARAEHDTTEIADGDQIEVVTFVGGG